MPMLRRWFNVLRLRIRSFVRGSDVERDLDEELRFHLERTEAEYIAGGLDPAAARRAALIRLGGTDQCKEECRESRGISWHADVLRQDLRIAVRMLFKARGLTAAAIVSLALGIGANTAMFGVVSAMLLEPLPYPEPDRLVKVWAVHQDAPEQKVSAAAPEYWAWKSQATLFEAMGTTLANPHDLGADENGTPAERIVIDAFTPSMFRVLSVRPALGRPFYEEDAPVGAQAPVIIISDELWQRRFNRDPHVINRTVRIDGEPRTIVGIMPPGFAYLDNVTVNAWEPYALNPRQLQGSARAFPVVGRLRSGVTLAQAQAEIDRIASGIAKEFPARNAGWGARVETLHDAVYGGLQTPLLLLEGAVGLVLLIACANVAGLLLARAASRTTEMALRAAIGAARGRIIRQVLTESVLLGLAGGIAGIALALAAVKIVALTAPDILPRLQHVAIDGSVFGYTGVVSILTGLLFGLAPALQASRSDLVDPLRASTRVAVPRQHRARSVMVVAQVALTVVLLVGSTLMIRSLLQLRANNLG